MAWRKWLVRGLVFTVAGGFAGAGWLYLRWTDPAVVRQQVVDRLQVMFPQAVVALESARLRILGGIALNELRLVRRDDPSRTDFAYIPSARVYHDKEQILDGKLAFRKVELYRPRLRVVREKDGHWNWADVMGAPDPSAPLPALIIDDGTLLLEDHLGPAGVPPLELTNVQLTLINDPLSTVTVEGSGRSEILGRVELRASWRRDTHEGALHVKAAGVPLTAGLLGRLCCGRAAPALAGLYVEGSADVEATLHYQPGSAERLTYDVSGRLHEGKLRHPHVPLPLEHVELQARCAGGRLTVERLTATSGVAELAAHGEARVHDPEQDFKGVLTIKHLTVTEELCRQLPETLQRLHKALKPSGPVGVVLKYGRQQGQWQQRHCELQPEGAAICYEKFPYPVHHITGSLDIDVGERAVKMDLTGFAGSRPVFLQGAWKGAGQAADVQLELHAEGIPLDEQLITALPEEVRPLARSFHARGRGDIRAHIRHRPGQAAFENGYHAGFRDTSVKWAGFPYPVENVTGQLDIYPDHHYEFHHFTGTHNGAEIRVHGHSFPHAAEDPPGTEPRIFIEIGGRDVGIDGDLRQALEPMPGLAKAWDNFRPAGRMSFQARVDRLPGRPQDLDVAVEVHGCAMRPAFFPYAFADLDGRFRYAGSRVYLEQFRASHGDSRVSIAHGTVDLSPRGAFWALLEDVRANPLVPDADFVAALPKTLKAGVTALKLTDPFALQARRVVVALDDEPGSRPDVYWEGQMWLEKARLNLGVDVQDVTGTAACVGRYDGQKMRGLVGNVALSRAAVLGQPFEDVHSHFEIKEKVPGILLVGLYAPLYGGDVSGQARLDFGPTLRYELDLTASQIDMGKLGKHNLGEKSELGGLAWARLWLTGQGEGISTLDGNGSVHVPRGKLGNLPLLLDLLKFLGLRLPDRTFFEEAHADFSIHGNRMQVDQLDLWGSVLSLQGKGSLNLNGTDAHLDFYPSWGRIEQLLPATIRTVPPALSKNLLKIEVRGKVGGRPEELQLHKKPIPVLVEPLLQLRDRVLPSNANK
jgi:hypothetical protein